MTTKPKLTNSKAESGQAKVKTYTITPNSGSAIKVGRGFYSLDYFESIFDTTIRAESVIVDASGPTGGSVNIIDKAQMTSGEKVTLSLEDGYKNQLNIKEFIIQTHNYMQDVKGVVVDISMYSDKVVENEDVKNRIIKKYKDILISDIVFDIVSSKLKSKVDTDTSLGKFTYEGDYTKDTPFDACLKLANRCVPNAPGAKGTLAGYLFYQTSEGYKFKSIDKLFEQSPKMKLIYNDKIDAAPETGLEKLPPGYDAKVLSYKFNESMNLDKLMYNSTFARSDQITVNPFKTEYKEERPFDAQSQNKIINNAGKEVPVIAKASNFSSRSFTRNTRIKDTGELKSLNKSKEVNLPVEEVIRQAQARYNQIAVSSLKITIPLNFKLHAGDIIQVDFPEPSSDKKVKVSKRKSGRYLIESLRHRIAIVTRDPLSNITILSLVRDTEVKK